MGNVYSAVPQTNDSAQCDSGTKTMENDNLSLDSNQEEPSEYDSAKSDEESDTHKEHRERAMEEFRQQLQVKRDQRKDILSRHRAEKEEMKLALQAATKKNLELQQVNKRLQELLNRNNIEVDQDLLTEDHSVIDAFCGMREELDELKSNNIKLRRELSDAHGALQGAYSDIADLNSQNIESMKQINALKEVIAVSKTLIGLREQQLNELKNKLNEIERSLADREASMLSTDLRQEYERQLQNIRTLRTLYEERARLAEVTRQGLLREIEEQKALNQSEVNKCKELTAKIEELEEKVKKLDESLETKDEHLRALQVETKGLEVEMGAVNKLFSKFLLGYKTEQDLDKMVLRLEEYNGLLTQVAEREEGTDASTALPKLLLELVSQVDDKADKEEKVEETTKEEESSSNPNQESSMEEIVQNLPKVWRVLMELLSHQTITDKNTEEKVTTCYKSVETASGPVLVPSVSQTYIRLKDLIVEKLNLIKEVNRMKQLNVHLESRLEEQERRLCLVTTELSKTWHVVGRLRRHHHQLHTHEKILKYELQQKRKLLNELKEELEYCKEKWDQAKEKNSQSEKDWRKLRAEFSNRKIKDSGSFNNSAESGYSDERQSEESSESNDESEYQAEPLLRCKRKIKTSFETILDSSTDVNVAEREDPASDMVDVAELPLDSHEGDDNEDNPMSTSESCSLDNILKKDKSYIETDDETGADVLNEISNDDVNIESDVPHSESLEVEELTIGNETDTDSIQPGPDIPTINPSEILENVRRQNERLARKDEKLSRMEQASADLLDQTKKTTKISEDLDKSLDQILTRPSSSNVDSLKNKEDTVMHQEQDIKTGVKDIEQNEPVLEESIDEFTDTLNKPSCSFITQDDTTNKYDDFAALAEVPKIDTQAILESIRKQNERLAKKDERLKSLEDNCASVVSDLSSTLNSGIEIANKLDSLHKHREYPSELNQPNDTLDGQADETKINDSMEAAEEEENAADDSEPSTSSDVSHEARFAARDLRLKKLEEQTRSLVNKVNKTTSKGVKIHYKLEELHNIYGSENSRAGTPSGDNEDVEANEESNEDSNPESQNSAADS